MMRESRFTPYKRVQTAKRRLNAPRKTAAHFVVNLNDQVQTPHGSGKVIEISNDLYLVALEGQIARVWERINSLKVLPSKSL
jgi:hypothetical protein